MGNQRGNLDRLIETMGPERFNRVRETAIAAAALFPQSLTIGADILIEPGFQRCFVLELNAFGDLLPRIYFNGRDTYGGQIAELMDQTARPH